MIDAPGGFLPLNGDEMHKRGWDEVDFIYVSGDAYVDHPSFGAAIITRVLESEGFRVGFLSQPDWHSASAFTEFGRPRFGFFVSSGNIDILRQKNAGAATHILPAESPERARTGQ